MKVLTARRLEGLQEYYFSRKMEQIRQLEGKGHDVINLGIGSPDLPPHPSVIKALNESALDPSNHSYQSYKGIAPLRSAIAEFMDRHFAVACSSDHEILPLIGSKEGITHISLAFLDEGDQVLIPEMGYPTYTSVTNMLQAEPVYYPLLEDENWEPDWDFLDALNTERVKLLWLNYPHMPTGAIAKPHIFARLVEYARKRDILLCHDNPYSFILNDPPMSIFQFDRKKEVSLELHSLSKSFNMAGWRVGWLCGNETNVQSVLKIKSNVDSGMFKPVQLAAVKALSMGHEWFEPLNQEYHRRRELAFEILDALGCQYHASQAGMFAWAKTADESAETLSDRLLADKDVFITPGFIFGDAGERYVRISLCTPEARLTEALQRICS